MSNYQELEQDQLYKIRHSAAHVMAQAVLGIYPDAKVAIGPPIDTGFYYDIDLGLQMHVWREHNGELYGEC